MNIFVFVIFCAIATIHAVVVANDDDDTAIAKKDRTAFLKCCEREYMRSKASCSLLQFDLARDEKKQKEFVATLRSSAGDADGTPTKKSANHSAIGSIVKRIRQTMWKCAFEVMLKNDHSECCRAANAPKQCVALCQRAANFKSFGERLTDLVHQNCSAYAPAVLGGIHCAPRRKGEAEDALLTSKDLESQQIYHTLLSNNEELKFDEEPVWPMPHERSLPMTGKIHIRLQAKIYSTFHRFDISLHVGQHINDDVNDIAFHMSVRFEEDDKRNKYKIVFNSRQNKQWMENEERVDNPFKVGSTALGPNNEIRLEIDETDAAYIVTYYEFPNFWVSHQLKEYKKRSTPAPTHLTIQGDLQPIPVQQLIVSGQSSEMGESYYITYAFNVGKTVIIKGIPYVGWMYDDFYIDFRNTDHSIDGDIPLGIRVDLAGSVFFLKKKIIILSFFNPHFFAFNQKVYRATYRTEPDENGFMGWDSDEHDGVNPFKQGVEFELKVQNEEDKFRITVNGQEFCTYKKRIPDHIVEVELGGGFQQTHAYVGK